MRPPAGRHTWSAEVSVGDGPWDDNGQWHLRSQKVLVVAPGTERITVGSSGVFFTSLTIFRYEIGGPILEILDQSCLHKFNATGITPRQHSELHAAADVRCASLVMVMSMEGRDGEHAPCLEPSCRSTRHDLHHDVFHLSVLLLIHADPRIHF